MAEDIETIRLLIGDRRKAAVNEIIGEGDGTNLNYQVDMFPLTSSPTASLSILSSGVLVAAANYNISGDVGRITFLSAPTAGNTILGNYEYHAFNSAELSDFLSGHTGDPYLAAANACLGLAGDTSKFFAYTLGEKAVDKRRISRDLRELMLLRRWIRIPASRIRRRQTKILRRLLKMPTRNLQVVVSRDQR